MQPLNYEQLLNDYNEALNTRLRGFRPAEEYLDIWVPDNDHAKSILNLVEAAEMAGRDQVAVSVSEATLKTIDMTKLQEMLKKISTSVEISTQGAGVKMIQVQLKPVKESLSGSGPRASSTASGPSPYRLSLSRRMMGLDFTHEELAAKAKSGEILVSSAKEGGQLFLAVEQETNRITNARYHFSSGVTPETKALFELFCETIEGLPVQEAADHGVLRLEFSLREPGQKPAVKGIVTPWNAEPMFRLPMDLIRLALADYKAKTGYKAGINFFDKMPSEAWTNLTDEERIARVQNFIDNFLKNSPWSSAALRVTSLQGQGSTRVFCMFDSEVAAEEKAKLLMDLEIELRKNLEGRLEVFMEEKKDQNSKRRL